MRSFLKQAVLLWVLITGSIAVSFLNAREVDIDLLLLIDSSGSIDEIESQLQFQAMQRLFVTRRSSIQF